MFEMTVRIMKLLSCMIDSYCGLFDVTVYYKANYKINIEVTLRMNGRIGIKVTASSPEEILYCGEQDNAGVWSEKERTLCPSKVAEIIEAALKECK